MKSREHLNFADAAFQLEGRTHTRKTDGYQPFLEDALGVFMQPELCSHPDYHDGWAEMRPRQIALSSGYGAGEQVRRMVVTASDHEGLREALKRPARRGLEPTIAKQLALRLAEAQVLSSAFDAPGVVTMNSSVLCEDTQSGEFLRLRLVYPHEERPTDRHVSVLHPIGGALLGLKIGELADWPDQGRFAVRDIQYADA